MLCRAAFDGDHRQVLGQQIGTVARDLPQFRYSGSLLHLGQVTPAGITPGRAG